MSTLKCKKCSGEIESIMDICPHCGKKVEKNLLRNAVIAAVILIVTISIIGVVTYSKYNNRSEKMIQLYDESGRKAGKISEEDMKKTMEEMFSK